ncbi:ABC transporter permease [Patescibacteria group bacterium]|nr:ABC transporter permease [Patescibacteria group bacterium]
MNNEKNSNDQRDKREELAEKFKDRMEKVKEEKPLREVLDDGEVVFHATDPSAKYNTMWTVFLVVLLVIALGIIVYLLVKGGTDQSLVQKQEKLIVYNELKNKYDQSLVEATNELIQAENSFNSGDYVEVNDLAQQAEDEFDRSIDYLYDIKSLQLGEEYQFLEVYYNDLESVSQISMDMSNTLAYAARLADRDDEKEAQDSLDEYEDLASDVDLKVKQIESFKQSHQGFF